MRVRSLGWEEPLEEGMVPWRAPPPVSLPGESRGQRSQGGCSPWGCKESNTTEVTEHAHTADFHKHFNTMVSLVFQTELAGPVTFFF